jgi:hypothetical protein
MAMRKKLFIISRAVSKYYRSLFFNFDKFFFSPSFFSLSTLGNISPFKFGYFSFFKSFSRRRRSRLSFRKFDKIGIPKLFFVKIFLF